MSNQHNLEGKRVLYLTLKAKWFDLIKDGVKLEEYRDVTEYWIKRLYNHDIVSRNSFSSYKKPTTIKKFDIIRFARGGHFHQSIPQMDVICEGIEIRDGNPEWGAERGKEYFVIKLGNIIKP